MPTITEVCPSSDLLEVIAAHGNPTTVQCDAAGAKSLLGYKTILASEVYNRLAHADIADLAAVLLVLRGDCGV